MKYTKITLDGKEYFATRSLAVDKKLKAIGIDTSKYSAMQTLPEMLAFFHACLESGAEYAELMGMSHLDPPSMETLELTMDPHDVLAACKEIRDKLLTESRDVIAKEKKKEEEEA